MKIPSLALCAVIAAAFSIGPGARAAEEPSVSSTDKRVELATLSWRCGKNNPAMWGTFGNGCLKQKRAWKAGRNA